jgi:hypothetical protein
LSRFFSKPKKRTAARKKLAGILEEKKTFFTGRIYDIIPTWKIRK